MNKENLQSSFIPQAKRSGGDYRKSSYNLFSITGILIFISLILSTGGLYSFNYYLDQKKKEVEENLPKVEEVFDSELLRDLNIANARVRMSENLLKDRVAPSIIFSVLERFTIEDVYFHNFEYRSHQIQQDKITTVRMLGSAPTFNAVAFQSDVLKRIRDVKNIKVSNVRLIIAEGRDFTGQRVSFEVELEFEERDVLYSKTLNKRDI